MKLLTAIALLALALLPATVQADEKESVYERVMRTQTIRCGWAAWDPYVSVDPNTGALSGLMVEYAEMIGENLGLAIDWSAEIGWGDFVAALNNGRIDMFCAGVAVNAQRSREVDFIRPAFFMGGEIFVAADDHRFDEDISLLDDPGMTMTVIEGEIFGKIIVRDFPESEKLELPQLASSADLFLSVATGKADATLSEIAYGRNFMKNNPDKVRMIELEQPYTILPLSLSVAGGEERFRRMIDNAAYEVEFNGSLRKLMEKYDPDRAFLLGPTQSYTKDW